MPEENTQPEIIESMDDYKDELEASFRKINVGDILTGTVIDVNEEEVTLDLRYYAPGIIPVEEWSNAPGFSIAEHVAIGDTVEATVIETDDGKGNLILSRKEANDVLAWDKLSEAFETQKAYTLKIQGVVPSGVIVYPEGIRAFIPASQLSLSYVEDLNPWLGQTVTARIITLDKAKEKIVLSAKVIQKELQEEEQAHRISLLVPGSIVEGTVESLMPYGAFVDLGNEISGLVHISQISEKRIKKPDEVLHVGDKVKVKILNTNDGKVSLSIRALQEEMVDTSSDEIFADAEKYLSKESASTSLGDMLSKFKFD